VPASLEAKVVDDDRKLWLRVPAGSTLIVLGFQGEPEGFQNHYSRSCCGSVVLMYETAESVAALTHGHGCTTARAFRNDPWLSY